MQHSSFLFPIIVFALAFGMAYLILLFRGKGLALGQRKEQIDGLRGFLALAVFIHHAHIWYGYLHDGQWQAPKSNLYQQLGQTSVFFFFMITSYLFSSKLLEARERGFDFYLFFRSRVFRILPMYYFSLLLSIGAIMSISQWQLKVSITQFLLSIAKWLSFTIVWSRINDSPYTGITNAGVIWSLPYEWLFYFSLPLLAYLILRPKPPIAYLCLSVLFLVLFQRYHGAADYNTLAFGGGIAAAFLSKNNKLSQYCQQRSMSLVVLLLFVLLGQYHSAANSIGLLLISLIFIIIASGNTMFGLLKNPVLQFLGDISYSTYLLQGIILFSCFYFVYGFPIARQFSEAQYALLICSLSPVLVLLSYWGFRYIEQPFIHWGKRKKH